MRLRDVRNILDQAVDLGTVKAIYFEGGEPFLYYATLLKGAQEAADRGFQVGIVTNGYWATALDDAAECLRPFAGLIQDLSVSSDLFHWSENREQQAKNAAGAAEELGIPIGFISIAHSESSQKGAGEGQLPIGESRRYVSWQGSRKTCPCSRQIFMGCFYRMPI